MTQNNLDSETENEIAKKPVFPEGPLKQIFLNYVGQKLQPENNEITVQMIVNTLAEEFPEFLLLIAEENFIRGYQQALADIDQFEKNNKNTNTEVQQTQE